MRSMKCLESKCISGTGNVKQVYLDSYGTISLKMVIWFSEFVRSFAIDPVAHSWFCFTTSTRFRDPQLDCHLPWIIRAKRETQRACDYLLWLFNNVACKRTKQWRKGPKPEMKWKKWNNIKMVKCDGIEIQIQIVFASLFSHFNLFYFIFSVRSSCNCRAQPNAMHSSRRLSLRLCFGRIFYFIPARLKARKFKFHFISRTIRVDLHSWNVLVCAHFHFHAAQRWRRK